MILKRKKVYIWTVLVVGWCFDILFWGKVPGISIPIFFILVLAAGFFLARQQSVVPAKPALWLLLPIVFLGTMTVIRLEPMTTFLNIAASLALMGILAHSFLGGKWWLYNFRDHIVGSIKVALDCLIRPIAVLTKQPEPEVESGQTFEKKPIKSISILRGLLLAIPVVLVFAAMLAEADPIFDQGFHDVLDLLNIEDFGEYILRGILIAFIGYFLLGVYLHAFYKNHDETLSTEETRWIPRFLGFTESAVVLLSVNLLFLSFVIIQFQYFFGGKENVHIDGFTYAEYARRGFGELVIVALFSLLLFLGLSAVTKKTEKFSQSAFSGLGILLVSLVTVILVSSFRRLLLYEEVYGFTRQRTYTHVFIIWLGVLLAAVILLEVFRKQQRFALAATLAVLGFVTSLNLINVDGFIVTQNVNRALRGETLDISYLSSLSEDALPVLSAKYAEAEENNKLFEEITGIIACHAAINGKYEYDKHRYRNYTWQSFHFSRFRAQQVWENIQVSEDPETFQVHVLDEADNYSERYVLVDGEKIRCNPAYHGWD